MNYIASIRKLAFELEATHDDDVVKVAGIYRKIKNWWQAFTDPQYANEISSMQQQSVKIKHLLDELGKYITQMQSAIADNDVYDYQLNLDAVRELSVGLAKELSDYTEFTESVEEQIPEEQVFVPDAGDTPEQEQGKRDLSDPDAFPPGHDVPVNGNIREPVQNFRWFQQFTPDEIQLTDRVIENAQEKLANVLSRKRPITNNSEEDKAHYFYLLRTPEAEQSLLSNLPNAILNGILIKYGYAKESEKVKDRARNQMEAGIWTSPFNVILPASQESDQPIQIIFEAFLLVNDIAAGYVGGKRLSVRGLMNATVKNVSIASQTERMIKLTKLLKQSEKVPRRKYKIPPVDFATYLMKAYQLAFGKLPNVQTVGVMWAQGVHENGGRVNTTNYNFGGLSAGNYDKAWNSPGWIKSGYPYRWSAADKQKQKAYDVRPLKIGGHEVSGPLAGALDYILTLKYFYPDTFKWKSAGLAFDDAMYLKSKKYYGGPAKIYGGNMDKLFKEFMEKIYPNMPEKPPFKPTPPPAQPKSQYVFKDQTVVRPKLVSEKYGYQGEPSANTPGDAKELARDIARDLSPSMPFGAKELARDIMTDMPMLFAGPLEKLVKRSLERNLLPNQTILISLHSDSYPHLVRFAHGLSSALRSELDAETSVCHNKKRIEIECSIAGPKESVLKAVSGLVEGIRKAFKNTTGKVIKTAVFEGVESRLDVLDSKTSEKNFRKFALSQVRYG